MARIFAIQLVMFDLKLPVELRTGCELNATYGKVRLHGLECYLIPTRVGGRCVWLTTKIIVSSQRWFNLRLWCASRRQLKTHKQHQYTGKYRQILQGGTQGT